MVTKKPAELPSAPSRTRSKPWVKRVVLMAVVGAMVFGLIFSLRAKPIPVEVREIKRGTFVRTIREDGVTRVRERYVVSAPLSGNVGRLSLRAGDIVKEGAPLAAIRPALPPLLDSQSQKELQARLAASQASLARAKSAQTAAESNLRYVQLELARSEQLAAKGAEPEANLQARKAQTLAAEQDYNAARYARQVAAHEVEMARAALLRANGQSDNRNDAFHLLAPVDGKVLRVFQESETVVPAGAALFELGDPNVLEISVDVLTTDAVQIREGSKVDILRWGGPRTLEGRVRRIEPQASTHISALGVEEQRVNVIIDLLSEPSKWEGLGDGFRVEAEVEIERQSDALLVPETALFRDGKNWAVFSVSDEVATQRHVEIGSRNGEQAVVTAGLDAGLRVVLHPGDNLEQNSRVEAREAN